MNKNLIWCLIIVIIGLTILDNYKKQRDDHVNHFLDMTIDERGLISCSWVDNNNDTFALDYITPNGLYEVVKGDFDNAYKP